jgi:hypothetical protein
MRFAEGIIASRLGSSILPKSGKPYGRDVQMVLPL